MHNNHYVMFNVQVTLLHKVKELCLDKGVRHKMNDKSGIQGAINTSWTIHKTDLLQLQVDELSVKFNEVYKDKVTHSHLLSSVESNKKKNDRAHRKSELCVCRCMF